MGRWGIRFVYIVDKMMDCLFITVWIKDLNLDDLLLRNLVDDILKAFRCALVLLILRQNCKTYNAQCPVITVLCIVYQLCTVFEQLLLSVYYKYNVNSF